MSPLFNQVGNIVKLLPIKYASIRYGNCVSAVYSFLFTGNGLYNPPAATLTL